MSAATAGRRGLITKRGTKRWRVTAEHDGHLGAVANGGEGGEDEPCRDKYLLESFHCVGSFRGARMPYKHFRRPVSWVNLIVWFAMCLPRILLGLVLFAGFGHGATITNTYSCAVTPSTRCPDQPFVSIGENSISIFMFPANPPPTAHTVVNVGFTIDWVYTITGGTGTAYWAAMASARCGTNAPGTSSSASARFGPTFAQCFGPDSSGFGSATKTAFTYGVPFVVHEELHATVVMDANAQLAQMSAAINQYPGQPCCGYMNPFGSQPVIVFTNDSLFEYTAVLGLTISRAEAPEPATSLLGGGLVLAILLLRPRK